MSHAVRVSAARSTFVVRSWGGQFYLRRGDADWASDRVSPEGYEAGVEGIDGFVYVETTMYGSPTTVTCEVHSQDPGTRPEAQRFAETQLGGSGPLAIRTTDYDAPPVGFVELPTGHARLRVSWIGTAAAAAHPDVAIGGHEPSPESIIIDIWPT
jgi:hypothetical protein